MKGGGPISSARSVSSAPHLSPLRSHPTPSPLPPAAATTPYHTMHYTDKPEDCDYADVPVMKPSRLAVETLLGGPAEKK